MTTIKVELTGLNEALQALAKVASDGEQAVQDVIEETALLTERTAVLGIRSGAATGRLYKRGKRGTHRASAPGEYPASDTGRLMGSIMSNIQPNQAEVGTNVPYGEYLEFGTRKMAARPWLMPSFEQAISGVAARLRAELERRLK